MNHLLNENSDIIIHSNESIIGETKHLKEGDKIMVKQKCSQAVFKVITEVDYTRGLHKFVEFQISVADIMEICKKIEEIENMKPIESTYSNLPF